VDITVLEEHAASVYTAEPNPEGRGRQYVSPKCYPCIYKTAWSHKLENHKLISKSHSRSRRSCRFEPVSQECNSDSLQLCRRAGISNRGRQCSTDQSKMLAGEMQETEIFQREIRSGTREI
jgi:hypothetical protein